MLVRHPTSPKERESASARKKLVVQRQIDTQLCGVRTTSELIHSKRSSSSSSSSSSSYTMRSFRCGSIGTMTFVYVIFVPCWMVILMVQGQSNTNINIGEDNGLDGKDLPVKGDTKCPSLADRFHFFTSHNNSDSNSNSNSSTSSSDADIWLLPCKEENGDGSGSGLFGGYNSYTDDDDVSSLPTTAAELPPHAIVLQVYAALPAYASDFRTCAMTTVM